MGLVPGAVAARAIFRIAAAPFEPEAVRLAAVAALGHRVDRDSDVLHVLTRIAQSGGELGAVAALAVFDIGHQRERVAGSGLSIAQLFLHADLDRELSRAGAGDNGGIATMLVRLGDALAAESGVDRVLTLSRGTAAASVAALRNGATGHVLTPVPLTNEPVDAAHAWPVNVAAERGIRRALTGHGRVDVLHLRMADVGSMAASAVATRLGIPTVFTLAPDPHAVIHALDMTGALTRGNFGAVDAGEHYWFRTDLVRRLATAAHRCALFPRPELRDQLRDLLGIDIDTEPHRYAVVPEGIAVAVADAARVDAARVGVARVGVARVGVARVGVGRVERERSRGRVDESTGLTAQHPALAELHALISARPADRQGLPLAVSVGRLHRVKGMATVVQAWASDPALYRRCNLLIVGGELQHPTAGEQGQLAVIASVMQDNPDAATGLVLPGHRPNDVVAHWMAATHSGLGSAIAPGGVYVCGSLKEEFGLALIEALAAGLVVFGPDAGGPAPYVDDGETGFLIDTRSPRSVGAGMSAALDLAVAPGAEIRAERAGTMVRERFTIEAMAGTLVGIYAGITAPVAG